MDEVGEFIYLKDVLRASLKRLDPEGKDIRNCLVRTVLDSLERAEARAEAAEATVDELRARW